MDFQWFVGEGLAKQLPFRKRYSFFGEKVCEWGVIMPMAKAGFMVGCALASASPRSAEFALQYTVKPDSWREVYTAIVENLIGRLKIVGVESVSFEDLFPEWLHPSVSTETLMSESECVTAIGQRVTLGLVVGILAPDASIEIIRSWISQKPAKRALGIRGLSVQESPGFGGANLEDTQKNAKILYDGWKNLLP
jgi:hypothetical protein